MITLHPQPRRALRNWTIASIIALAASLAPIVRTDTVRFFHTVFAGNQPIELMRAVTAK